MKLLGEREKRSSEPREDLAHSRSFIARARYPGRVFFGYFLLCEQSSVTRAPDARGKPNGRASRIERNAPTQKRPLTLPSPPTMKLLGEREKRSSTARTGLDMALDLGPPFAAAKAGRNRPQGRAHEARAFANGHGCPSSEPRPVFAHSRSFIARARHPGCISLVTFFVQAKKVTRAPDARGKSNGRGRKRIRSKIKMDSSLRWNDERKMRAGFLLLPE
jgi:hypothetical protein